MRDTNLDFWSEVYISLYYLIILFKLGFNLGTLFTTKVSGASGYWLCKSWSSFGYSKSTSKTQGYLHDFFLNSALFIHLKPPSGNLFLINKCAS